MKLATSILSALFLVTVLTHPVSGACPEFSNWSTSWTDSFGQTKYSLKAPCKVYLGIPFTITATAADPYYPDNAVGWNWKIIDNGVIRVQNYDMSGIRLSDGKWETTLEQTYTGSPIDHTLQFSFTDYGQGSGGHSWGGSTVGGLTVDPYFITLGTGFSFRTDQLSTSSIPATVVKPSGSNPLTYRWLEGAVVIQASLPVNGTGEVNVPLSLATVPALSAGSHILTLEVTDGYQAGFKTTVLTVSSAPPVPPPSSVPVMEGWWLLPGVLAGVGIFVRRRKE